MKSYSTFHFSSYSWNHHAGKISLKYSLDREVDFEEIIKLPEPISDERLKEKEWEIERLLFALHLIGGISYYKTALPKNIEIHSGTLTLQEAKFWNSVYENGLGEFFYKNNIDFRGLIKFPATKEKEPERNMMRRKEEPNALKRILVPIGGGKDSVVTAELLKKTGANLTLLRMEPHPIIDELSHAIGVPLLTVRRILSPTLFDLNKQGALNGHVPITAYLSILSCLIAVLYDFDGVAMSNERSANEGNVEYKGMTINHQWSKSEEFERMMQRYLGESILTNTAYFSLLRPLSELRITEIFTSYPQYFSTTTSCNKNWRILQESAWPAGRSSVERSEGWCNKCPKCAFVFSCMAAFLPRKTLQDMFGSVLYEDEALLPLYRELLGLEKFKPFECVGTSDEVKAAFLLTKRRGELNNTPVMKMFEAEVLPTIKDPETLIASTLAPSKKHSLPNTLSAILHSTF